MVHAQVLRHEKAKREQSTHGRSTQAFLLVKFAFIILVTLAVSTPYLPPNTSKE